MMKSKKGITMIILVITVFVLMIITAITLNVGFDSIDKVKEDRLQTQLLNVQQAIFQQYMVLRSNEEDGQIPEISSSNVEMANDSKRPKELIGTRIVSENKLIENGFREYKVKYDSVSTMPFEKYYYILQDDDIAELGLREGEQIDDNYRYIVNYSTGEVFDIEHKIYIDEYDEEKNGYLEGTGNTDEVETNKYNFVD